VPTAPNQGCSRLLPQPSMVRNSPGKTAPSPRMTGASQVSSRSRGTKERCTSEVRRSLVWSTRAVWLAVWSVALGGATVGPSPQPLAEATLGTARASPAADSSRALGIRTLNVFVVFNTVSPDSSSRTWHKAAGTVCSCEALQGLAAPRSWRDVVDGPQSEGVPQMAESASRSPGSSTIRMDSSRTDENVSHCGQTPLYWSVGGGATEIWSGSAPAIKKEHIRSLLGQRLSERIAAQSASAAPAQTPSRSASSQPPVAAACTRSDQSGGTPGGPPRHRSRSRR
jgi:hypothetical protein